MDVQGQLSHSYDAIAVVPAEADSAEQTTHTTIDLFNSSILIFSSIFSRNTSIYTNMQVLLLGGHGKIALHLTPLLLNRAWNVTSVVRNPDHEKEILALGKGRKGNLSVLISSLADIKSAADAQQILNSVMPDYVVWSAGTCPSLPRIRDNWVQELLQG